MSRSQHEAQAGKRVAAVSVPRLRIGLRSHTLSPPYRLGKRYHSFGLSGSFLSCFFLGGSGGNSSLGTKIAMKW